MRNWAMVRIVSIVFGVMGLVSCAGTETVVSSPVVDLNSIELAKAGFRSQTFHLGFDVENPNPFPLPVKAVRYRVQLDEEKFASGQTAAGFTVPARGHDAFMISVDLDFLNTASQLASLLQGGVPEQVSYELTGNLEIDIPFTRPIPFSSSGTIRISGGSL